MFLLCSFFNLRVRNLYVLNLSVLKVRIRLVYTSIGDSGFFAAFSENNFSNLCPSLPLCKFNLNEFLDITFSME